MIDMTAITADSSARTVTKSRQHGNAHMTTLKNSETPCSIHHTVEDCHRGSIDSIRVLWEQEDGGQILK